MQPITDVMNASALAVMPSSAPHAAQPARDFEALFIETLLQHAGLAKSLETEGGSDGGMFGELMVHELAHQLAGQLHLGFGAALGMPASGQQ